MKNIKYFLLLFIILNVSGCMNTLIRLWNGDGYYPPPAYRKASQECSQRYLEITPPPPPYTNKEWNIYEGKADNWISKCMKEKGF